MKPEIVFVKPKHPFRVEAENYHEDVRDEELNDVLQMHQRNPFRPAGLYMMGPYGIVPVAPHNSPSEMYNLWELHTNFSLTPSVKNCLKVIAGVEVLHFWTRYRAWLGIGRLFNAEKVQGHVRRELENLFRPAAGPEALVAGATSPAWALIQSPLRGHYLVEGQTEDEVLAKLCPSEAVTRASWL